MSLYGCIKYIYLKTSCEKSEVVEKLEPALMPELMPELMSELMPELLAKPDPEQLPVPVAQIKPILFRPLLGCPH